MTSEAVKAALVTVRELWPRSTWTATAMTAFARALGKLEHLDADDAVAIISAAWEHGGPRWEPDQCVILAALRSADRLLGHGRRFFRGFNRADLEAFVRFWNGSIGDDLEATFLDDPQTVRRVTRRLIEDRAEPATFLERVRSAAGSDA